MVIPLRSHNCQKLIESFSQSSNANTGKIG